MLELFILNTVKIGSLYALLAMAFRLMFNVSPFFNISLGSIVISTAYAAFYLVDMLGLSIYLAVPMALFLGAVLSFLFERVIYKPMRDGGASPMILLVVSLGVYMIFESIIDIIFGPQYRTLTDVMDIKMISLGESSITITQIISIATSLLVLISLSLILRKTLIGKKIRAIKNNLNLSRVYGIETNKVIAFVSILTGVILAVAGVLTIYETGVEPNVGFNLIFKGMIAAMIGGTSIWGVYLGAMFLALAENMGVWAFSSEWRDAVAFTIFIIFLLIKPWLPKILKKMKKGEL